MHGRDVEKHFAGTRHLGHSCQPFGQYTRKPDRLSPFGLHDGNKRLALGSLVGRGSVLDCGSFGSHTCLCALSAGNAHSSPKIPKPLALAGVHPCTAAVAAMDPACRCPVGALDSDGSCKPFCRMGGNPLFHLLKFHRLGQNSIRRLGNRSRVWFPPMDSTFLKER